MKKLAVILMIFVMVLSSCGTKTDKSLTISGDTADLADAVYFLAGDAMSDGTRGIYRLDKETMEIASTGKAGRSLWVWEDKLYYNQYDSIAELGQGVIMGEYPDMYRFVLTEDVLYYPSEDGKTVMWERKKPDRMAEELAFPVFDTSGAWLPVTITVQDGGYEAYDYRIDDSYVMHSGELLAYNDGAFHVYGDRIFAADGKKINCLSRKTEMITEYEGEAILAAAHGRLYVRDGENLRVYLLDVPHQSPMKVEEGYFDGADLVHVDSYSPVIYRIDRNAMTADKLVLE